VIKDALAEPCLAQAKAPENGGLFYQFERQGYFVRDTENGEDGRPVFNKTVGLRDTWAKIKEKQQPA
jgi:glutaminyl-tRNA synthetase